MDLTIREIADHISGKVEGNADARISKISRIESGKPGSISFLANPKYEKYIYTSKASAIIINDSFELQGEVKATLIRVKNAYESIAEVMTLVQNSKKKRLIPTGLCYKHLFTKIGKGTTIGVYSVVSKTAKIGKNCDIYPQVYIGSGVEIGDNTVIYAGVKIYDDCKIGSNCIIHSNAVIGADGFGFAPMPDGSYKKVPQLGNVIIEDDCEIGANTTIDRGSIGPTIVRKGVKLDNLVQVAHNVEVDENTVIAAQSGIAGSSKIGKNCVLAGQVGISGHLSIADKTVFAAQTGLTKSIKESGKVFIGSPALEHKVFVKAFLNFRNSAK